MFFLVVFVAADLYMCDCNRFFQSDFGPSVGKEGSEKLKDRDEDEAVIDLSKKRIGMVYMD